ncbi:MAG: S9 family peptidase [Pedobacter sp.]|nr:MAG: S9 family peptidase [Pedobacter sp.]
MKKLFFFLLAFGLQSPILVQAQQLGELTVEKIMRDPKWMGVSPSQFRWSADSKTIFFNWNPEQKVSDAKYQIKVGETKPVLTDNATMEAAMAPNYLFNKDKSLSILEKSGDIYLVNMKTKLETRLTNTVDREFGARFLVNNDIVYQKGDNLFQWVNGTGETIQRTHFLKGKRPSNPERTTTSAQNTWLRNDQVELFDIIKKNNRGGQGSAGAQATRAQFMNMGARGGMGAGLGSTSLQAIYIEDKILGSLAVSPDGRFVSYRLTSPATGNQNIIVPNYVTASGYTENIPGRTKVGENQSKSEYFIYDGKKDSVYQVKQATIPGIKDLPDYLKDYPKEAEERKQKNLDRPVTLTGPIWNNSGSSGIMVATSADNKDLWILNLNAENGELNLIDRQRDEAWIAGPGIGARGINWIDDIKFYFQSEATGYSHLYVYNTQTKAKTQLTKGEFEIQKVQLSNDKKHFYITANKEHPGITHFYKLPVTGGEMVQITSMKGGNDVTMSPDEKWIAINYSYMNKPWELYIQANSPGAKAEQITKSTTAEFDSYAWREPDMVKFKNRHGDDVYARVYPAKNPDPNKPAVLFVHGAGYLQNVHFWWSQYFREYMFNNLLADNGYTVMDIDFTASSGYGRNHRTGIYRHMGGKDLSDHVDGVKYLVENYGVNPKNVGLYGGSYGGFITLMGLFTEPDVFKSGAALRSVTDWAHYNHGYTSNILNEPVNDPLAYKRSSPIYFAEKFKGNLLMAHGMVDVNVNFQDIVRLSQRLIELGKDNWELAVYPIEDHGFVEPSSWTDEYKRILKLFDNTLKANK